MIQIINSNIEYPPPVMIGRRVEDIVIVDSKINATVVLIIPKITCPALIFAANRKESVIGRIIDLSTSTTPRKGAIGLGAFSGRKRALLFFVFLRTAVVIKVNHSGRAILRVTSRCEDNVTKKGMAPVILRMIRV